MVIAIVLGFSILLCPFIQRKHYKLYGFLVSLVLSYCAFHVNASSASDLYRHMQEIELYRIVGFDLFAEDFMQMKNPLTNLMYYLFSFVEDNRWYPAVIIFTIYFIIFSLLNNIAKDENLTQKQLALCTTFVLINFSFFFAIFAIRMWLVFSIFAYCLYTETVRKKKVVLCWIIYILLVLFHYAALFLLLARILAFFVMNPPTTINRLFSSVIMLIAVIVVSYYVLGSDLGNAMQDKFQGYSSYTTRGTWQTIECWLRAVAVFCLAAYQLLQIRDPKLKCVSFVIVFIFIIMLVMSNNYQITLRFPDGLVLLSGCLLVAFTKHRGAEYYYPVLQLFLIVTTLANAAYVLMFDFNNLSFTF